MHKSPRRGTVEVLEYGQTRLWAMRAVFIALALVVMFIHLLPLQITPQRFAGPDVLVALTFAWALRRPDYVPALSIALVMLLADLLFHRPPALWALLVLMASEWLKARGRTVRENTFVAEWVTVSAVLAVITILYLLVLALLILPTGMLSLVLMQFGMTVLIYPLVTATSHVAFGVRRVSAGAYDHTGRML